MGVTPITGWFVRENPSINGWFRGTPIYGNPHVFSKWRDTAMLCCFGSQMGQPCSAHLSRTSQQKQSWFIVSMTQKSSWEVVGHFAKISAFQIAWPWSGDELYRFPPNQAGPGVRERIRSTAAGSCWRYAVETDRNSGETGLDQAVQTKVPTVSSMTWGLVIPPQFTGVFVGIPSGLSNKAGDDGSGEFSIDRKFKKQRNEDTEQVAVECSKPFLKSKLDRKG